MGNDVIHSSGAARQLPAGLTTRSKGKRATTPWRHGPPRCGLPDARALEIRGLRRAGEAKLI
eukprot:2747066-Karenia_brevis.AAC.1